MIRHHYITLLFFVLSTTVNAQNGTIEFIENKGQWDSRVKFRSEVPAGSVFIRSGGGVTVLQHNIDDLKQLYEVSKGHEYSTGNTGDKTRSSFVLRSHAYAIDFANASDKIEIVPDKPQSYYNNYFIGDDPSKWASQCKIYQGITAKNIYPGVDVRYYTDNGNMKYDIIVKPGADISKIVLRYTGADKLEIKDKKLVIRTTVGEVKELEPLTYQYEKNQRRQISAKYVIVGSTIRFDIKNYNRNEVLVIDPTLIFSSFTGSTGDNWGFTATYGADGSFFAGGINLQPGFPVSTGAYQTVWGGGTGNIATDMSIMRLSPDGTAKIYATYIGGSGNDQPHSLITDAAGNLVIAGRTSSPLSGAGAFPLRNGSTDIIGPAGGAPGGHDIVVVKLNATGSALIGSKRIGGSGEDGVNITATRTEISLQQNYGDDGRSEVILDGAGNVYVASCTRSADFPSSPGAFQTSFGGGNQDGVLLKFNSNLSTRLFSSYLGGDGEDAAYVLAIGPTGDIYVAGGTESRQVNGAYVNSFPGNHTGTISGNTPPGGIDGFVAQVSNNGSSIIRSTFLGTSAIDQVYGIQFDRLGFPYVCGQTRGNWPIQNAGYSVAGAPQFIAKLKPDLSAFVYSTRFGKSAILPNISITAFLVDNCENVYVSGWGGEVSPFKSSSNTSGLPVTSDALQKTTDGSDFYFFVLKKNATSQLFGSFWGQNGGFPDHVDGGTSRFDKQGVIYQAICANCGGGASYTTSPPGVVGPANGAPGHCNLAMLKISFDFAGVDAGLQSIINEELRDTAGCAPLTVDFIDTIANGITYYWYFGDGSVPNPVITKVPNITHTYNLPGLHQVMLIAEDSSTCNIRDTAYLHIKVGTLRATVDFNPVKVGACDSLNYRFDNLSVAPPSQPFTDTSFRWDFGDNSPLLIAGPGPVFHSYAAPGSYIVKLILDDTAYCNSPETVIDTLRVAPLVEARFESPATGCVPYTAQFQNTSVAGATFIWDFGDGSTSTATDPSHTYNSPGHYIITLIANDPNTCNKTDTVSYAIDVFSNPLSDFSFSPDPPTENTPTTFNNLASLDAVKFKWLFGDGDSLETRSRLPVQHQYNATGTFNACLIAINAAGCADTMCHDVRALIITLVDVPNAFTPQSGDINSKVFAKGFGITKMRFIIWNRWGQKVFETNDRHVGWDGKYKGVIQPMDVYAYSLDVEFFDGTKTTKKGDITLIR